VAKVPGAVAHAPIRIIAAVAHQVLAAIPVLLKEEVEIHEETIANHLGYSIRLLDLFRSKSTLVNNSVLFYFNPIFYWEHL